MFFTYVNTPKNINDLFTVANTKNARKKLNSLSGQIYKVQLKAQLKCD